MAFRKKRTTHMVGGVLPIDKAQMGASLAKHARLLAKLPGKGKASIEQLEYAIHKAPATVEALMFGRGDHMGPGEVMLLVAAQDALGKGKPFVRARDHVVADPEVHGGDLHVKGSLTFAGNLFVLGDLIVDGLLCEHWHGAHCLVAGSIRARGIKCGGTILSGGGIAAEVVFVELEGRIGAGSALEADLVVVEGASARPLGKVKASNEIVLAHPNKKPLERLRALLAPSAFLTTDDGIFDYSALTGAITRNKPWAAGRGARPAKTPPAPRDAKAASTAKPRKAKTSRRRFVVVAGASKKFWEIRVDGPRVMTTYGRIGTPGQSTTKTFSGPSIAKEEAEKLVHAKRRKGYTEVA